MAALDTLGVPYFPSQSNFVLMKIGPLHRELVAAMRTHGVLLRDRSSDPGCEGYVRITVGVEAQSPRPSKPSRPHSRENWMPTL